MKKAVNEYAELEVIDGYQFVTVDGVCIPKIASTTVEQGAEDSDGICFVTIKIMAKLKNTIPNTFEISTDDLLSIINKKNKLG